MPLVGIDVFGSDTEDLSRDGSMNVDSVGEGFLHGNVAAEMGQDSQLDLRIVSANQFPAGFAWNKGAADSFSFRRSDRNVLQVRIA